MIQDFSDQLKTVGIPGGGATPTWTTSRDNPYNPCGAFEFEPQTGGLAGYRGLQQLPQDLHSFSPSWLS